MKKLYRKFWLVSLCYLLSSCGNPGTSPTAACSLCGALNNVTGEISTQDGSQSQMQGWVIASFEHDTGIARVGTVDGAGIFSLNQMRTDHAQTLALLTPDYILQGLLSIPGTVDKTILQWVQFQSSIMPRLINDGPTITFANLSNLDVQSWTSSCQADNGIPDGVAKMTASGLVDAAKNPANLVADFRPSLGLASTSTPVDRNGISNSVSPDVDGDGLINWLDPDDNGNAIYDVFDPDQNSDLINDLTPTGHNTDQWFTQGVQYFSVQFAMQPLTSGSGNQTTLTFTTQVLSDTAPIAVQIHGPTSLLNNATVVSTTNTGGTSSEAWDQTLVDDGSGTKTYTRQVVLANAVVPSAFQVLFLELVFGTASSPWYIDYPWTFAPITPASITAQYDSNTHDVQLVGNPYGTVQDFVWTINVYDSKSNNIWTSQAIPGATRQFAVNANIIQAGSSYTYSVVAESLDKVPGHPVYAVYSPQYPMK